MTREEFLKYKDEILGIIKLADEDKIPSEEEEKYYNRLLEIYSSILSSDLSSIPFEDWDGLYVFFDENSEYLDFSKTHANIDFKLVNIDSSKCNFKGCNLRNLEYFEGVYKSVFDDEVVKRYPNIFNLEGLDEEIVSSLKNGYMTFEKINKYPSCIPYLLPKSFGYSLDNEIVKYFGLENALRFYNENKDFILNITTYSFSTSSHWDEFFKNLDNSKCSTYEELCNHFYNEVYKYVTTKGYLSYVNADCMPKEFIEKHPDIFLEDNTSFYSKERYYSGSLSISDLRENREYLKDKNLFRGISNNSIIGNFKDIDAYYNEFPYVVDSLLEAGSNIIRNNSITFNSNDDIRNYLPILAKELIEKDYTSWFPYRIRDLITLKKYVGDAKVKLGNNHYEKRKNLTDYDINISILEEFDKNYPFLLDSNTSYYDSFSEKLSSYLEEKNITSINSYEELEKIIKDFIILEYNRGSSFAKELSSSEADNMHKLLPDYFLNNEEYSIIKNIIAKDEDRSYMLHAVQDALMGKYNSYSYVAKYLPDILPLITPKIQKFIFDDRERVLSYIYDKVGAMKFRELFSLYGFKTMELINNYSKDIYQRLESANENNIITILNVSIHDDIASMHMVDLNNLPDSYKKLYASSYLPEDAPSELKELYYHVNTHDEATYKTPFSFKIFHDHPDWIPYLKRTDYLTNPSYSLKNFITPFLRFYSENEVYDFLTTYGHIMYDSYNSMYFGNCQNREELNNLVLSKVADILRNSPHNYRDLPNEFRDKYPNYFLPDDAPDELKDKFYSKTLTAYDFTMHPEYLSYFDNTILTLGFNARYSWVMDYFKDSNLNQFKILSELEKINDVTLEAFFKKYIIDNIKTFNIEQTKDLVKVLSRLSYSNSTEIYNFRSVLATQILNTENPEEALDKIEGLFIKNNIPVVGKIYGAFDVLHPNMEGFNFNEGSLLSPELLKRGVRGRKTIVFADLVKCAAGSNNRSLKEYLKSLKYGNKLYEDLCTGICSIDTLSLEDKNLLELFYKHIYMLYTNTMYGKKNDVILTGDILQNISKLKSLLSPSGGLNYNLADRAVSMFCHFAGFDTVEELESYMENKLEETNALHEKNASVDKVTLKEGDFIKGIGSVDYLGRILQNGSVAKEFLGPSAGSDATPLDTDLSLVRIDSNVGDGIKSSISSSYGPIWFILKRDDRFVDSRPLGEKKDIKYDPNKYECFSTLSSYHYGIRTGFASSDIDYIVVEKKMDEKIPLEIVMNGFYIPVINFDGKVIFTKEDYDKLASKMNGLSYYDKTDYKFSSYLDDPLASEIASQVEKNNKVTKYKRLLIEKTIGEVLKEFGLTLKTKIDGDLTKSFAELIDTGSTARGTNQIGDGDFDFMLRLDRDLIGDRVRLEKLKTALVEKFESFGEIDKKEFTGGGDFRFKGVMLEDVKVDIDISFTVKTDKITYSTDRCLQDRLETIYNIDKDKYNLVCANIILAKKLFKEAGCYKGRNSMPPQGGLGGVGIENWILQHGGSFIEAATTFLEAAENTEFNDFVNKYQVFDFGENHYSAKNGIYPHDNFVRNNMDASGYNLMVQTIKKYLGREVLKESETTLEEEDTRKM